MDAHQAHEHHEKAHEAAHGHHGTSRSKRIGILISVLAALLAMVEIGGKSAQTNAMVANLESSDLWAFFQAKTIRMTVLQTSADTLELTRPPGLDAAKAAASDKQAAEWRAAAKRYDSDPEKNEGRKELAARAKAAEERRDHMLAAYHLYEYGAGAIEIGIVLASAAVVTGILGLAFLSAGFGAVGGAFGLVAWLAPTLVHF